MGKKRFTKWSWTLLLGLVVIALVLGVDLAQAKKNPPSSQLSGGSASLKEEPVIEEVSAKQLEKILNEKDYVAVFWYTRSCHTCDKVLLELEKIDDDTDNFGVDFVKINDKRLAKQYGIKNFPALTYFREKEPIIYEGDLMDEENVLDFLTSLEAMDLPDRIEEVNAKILNKIVQDSDYVAVLFCPNAENYPPTGSGSIKPESKKCSKALQELENIDDEADQLGIGFVKIMDADLAEEYNLGELPKLVYYRHQIPIIYEHELTKEEDVLEWLVQNKSTGDEEDVIEDVTAKTLNTLIGSIDNLVVLFYDNDDEDSRNVLNELEKIDDDCDKQGIQFVKIDDPEAAKEFGIDTVPALVYFEKEIPNLYDGDLENEDEILEWLVSQLESDEIEDVTDEMLDKLIKDGKTIAVLFYDNNDKKSQRVLNELENIDDECDKLGIVFVKIDNDEEAKEYGLEKLPALLYFESGIPLLYDGNLEEEEKVLEWLEHQQHNDEIEDITDEMLDMIIEKMPYVAVLFYDKDQKESQKVLAELENIDDECDSNKIAFVKIDDDNEAKEYGIDTFPTLVFFEKRIPYVYDGDLTKEEELLKWLLFQKKHSEIPEVTDEMIDRILETTPYLAVLFYDKDDNQDKKILNELENIDDDLEREGIVIVKMDDEKEAKELGIDDLPALVYFENKIPAIYEGDLFNEDEVLKWLIEQKNTATIEEVTDEILEDLIAEHEYVVVYFSGPCDEEEECDKILDELENIDDELDETGIVFVTTEDTGMAKKNGIKSFPALAFFRNKIPLFFKGDIRDEDEVLAWLTDEDTLEIPGRIEEVNSKMLDKIISERPLVVVFFYAENDKKSQKIINELENIDDECEEKDVTFVKISDDNIKEEYDLPTLPCLGFYRNKFRTIFNGDLMNEESILDWVLDLHDKTPDVIESVDRKTLQMLIEDVEHLAVFFYDDSKKSEDVLEELETIDDDTDKHGIQFVKSKDAKLASEIGIFSFPALVYYDTGVPIMYDGNLKNEAKVLEWLIEQKSLGGVKDADGRTCKCKTLENSPLAKTNKNSGKNKKIKDRKNKVFNSTHENFYKKTNKVLLSKLSDSLVENHSKTKEKLDEIKDESTGYVFAKASRFASQLMKSQQVSTAKEKSSQKTNSKKSKFNLNNTTNKKQNKHKCDDDFRQNDLMKTSKIFGDSCFIIGLGDKTAVPKNSYEPYKCCPTKVKKDTKVAKVTKEPAQIKKNTPDDKKSKSSIQEKKVPKLPMKPEPKQTASKSYSSYTGKEDRNNDNSNKIKGKKGLQGGGKYVWWWAKGQICIHLNEFLSPNGYDIYERLLDAYSPSVLVSYGDLLNEDEVLSWMVEQKDDESIEEVNRAKLFEYVDSKEFLAVIFYKEDDKESPRILRHIELIDDEAAEYGIKIVKCHDPLMAKKYGYRNPPGITYFRKGKAINYDGDIDDEEEILDWLTHPENMELTDHIERINSKMFDKIRQTSDYTAVFFYSDDCKQCDRVLLELEHIDDEAANAGIKFVKINDKQMAREMGVFALPGVAFYKMASKEPVIYAGDLYDENQILQWLLTQKDPTGDAIEEMEGEALRKYIDESDYVAVYFWNKTLCEQCSNKKFRKKMMKKLRREAARQEVEHGKDNNDEEMVDKDNDGDEDDGDDDDDEDDDDDDDDDGNDNTNLEECDQCQVIMEELENIDDDCDRHGISFVKTQDFEVAKEYGVVEFPSLVYFENQVPNVFEGDLMEEEEVLQWLITQKTEDRIELITRTMLETMVEETQYLAVYFYKLNCHICEELLEGLENIDDECDVFGIHLVKIQDPPLAKRYGIKTFPALVYFRNGNPLLYEGDLQNEEAVLEWLIDDDNRELADEIEQVNSRMLERLLDESAFLAVFLYDEDDCPECEEIMESLEKIDGEADQYGIDMVKISDEEVAAKYNIPNTPALVYFRKRIPLVYDGDLTDHEKILTWLTSLDVFDNKNEIEEVNRKMLDKLLDENEFLAVFFYELDHPESERVSESLEEIDGEIDNIDITFVKMADPRYARKWGVTKLPAIVFFRKRFPSIYRGELRVGKEVLEWLRKNRYRGPELGLFMCILIAIVIAFVLYTAFLLNFFRPAKQV